jgi:hypothetical protein
VYIFVNSYGFLNSLVYSWNILNSRNSLKNTDKSESSRTFSLVDENSIQNLRYYHKDMIDKRGSVNDESIIEELTFSLINKK